MSNMPIIFKNFDNIQYEIVLKKPHYSYNAIALCQDPNCKNPKIYIDPDRNENQLILDLFHELTHSFFWDLSETKVTKFANTFSRLLKEIKAAKQKTKKKTKRG
jgi:hypothetical protein